MELFLEKSCAPAIWVMAILELSIFIFLVVRAIKTKSKLNILVVAITFGLFYDAFIIALGTFIDPSKAVFISQLRFILHGLLIPLLFAITAEALNTNKTWKIILYTITGLLMIGGLAESLVTKLEVVNVGGLARMASNKGVTPAWAESFSLILSIGSVLPLIVGGIIVWKKEKTPTLFLSGTLMFLISAVAASFKEYMFYVTMYGEILMVIFLVLYIFKKEKKVI